MPKRLGRVVLALVVSVGCDRLGHRSDPPVDKVVVLNLEQQLLEEKAALALLEKSPPSNPKADGPYLREHSKHLTVCVGFLDVLTEIDAPRRQQWADEHDVLRSKLADDLKNQLHLVASASPAGQSPESAGPKALSKAPHGAGAASVVVPPELKRSLDRARKLDQMAAPRAEEGSTKGARATELKELVAPDPGLDDAQLPSNDIVAPCGSDTWVALSAGARKYCAIKPTVCGAFPGAMALPSCDTHPPPINWPASKKTYTYEIPEGGGTPCDWKVVFERMHSADSSIDVSVRSISRECAE